MAWETKTTRNLTGARLKTKDEPFHLVTFVFDDGKHGVDNLADCKLILRPLSSITDQEAIECAKIYNDESNWLFNKRNEYFAQVRDDGDGYGGGDVFTIWFPEDDTSIITVVDEDGDTLAFNQFTCIDWLRSRNFCLPFMGLDPVSEGWAILESENQPQQ